MKYLEQRVEELELEVKLLKAKNKLNDTSIYLNNYPPYNNPNKEDYMYNPSINLMSEPDLETAISNPWDSSELQKNLAHYKKEMLKQWEELPPVFTTSSESKFGKEPLLNYVDEILKTC
jgi:hypothetical protein